MTNKRNDFDNVIKYERSLMQFKNMTHLYLNSVLRIFEYNCYLCRPLEAWMDDANFKAPLVSKHYVFVIKSVHST